MYASFSAITLKGPILLPLMANPSTTVPGSPRTLGRREAELVAWLEVERPATISVDEVSTTFDWPKGRVYDLLSRLAKKGWLQRMAAGHYEPLLAESGGIPLANPWAALSVWRVPYYVSLASAAYERNLTLDRPGAVQACVPFGTTRPASWKRLPIALVHRRSFDPEGSGPEERHGAIVRLAGVERILLDSATMPGRVGGVFGLARIADRAREQADWRRFAQLAHRSSRGKPASRRIAALFEILGQKVPAELEQLAASGQSDSLLYLGSTRVHGRRGQILPRWRVLVNLSTDALREELAR